MEYRLWKTYVDKGTKKDSQDQFLRWINIAGSGMLNSPGIRPLNYVTTLLSESDLPAYLVLVTHEKTAGKLNPWDDVIDISKSEILYTNSYPFLLISLIIFLLSFLELKYCSPPPTK